MAESIHGAVFYTFEEYTRAFYKLYNQEKKGEDLLDFIHKLEDRVKEKIKNEPKPRVAIFRWKGNEISRIGINSGIEHLQYRTLQVRDAFKGQESKVQPKVPDKSVLMGRIDLEGLIAIDPDIIIMPYIIYTFENEGHIMAKPWELLLTLKDDPIRSEVKCFQERKSLSRWCLDARTDILLLSARNGCQADLSSYLRRVQ